MGAGHDRAEIAARDVVAAVLPPSELLPVLRECWDAGAALLPLDPGMPAPRREALLRIAAPTVVVEEGGRVRHPGEPAGAGDALVIATSGTTGDPRLVTLQCDAIESAVRASTARLGLQGDEPWLLCIPPWHIGGMLVLLRHLLVGAPLVVHDGFDAGAVAGATGVRCVSLVPTQVRRLVDAGRRLDHLTALVGGDALEPGLRVAAAAIGMHVVHTYGQSQSCGGVVYDGVPLDGVGVAVVDGEVLLDGPTLMRGYRGDDVATASAFDERGRLRTGDSGLLDDDGRLVVTGRFDDVIVTGGEKVVPDDVERVVRGLAGIADVAVIGEPDAEWGSRVVAVVVPEEGAQVTLEALRDAVRASLPAYAVPKRVVIARALPRTEAGKVRRSVLRDALRSA